MDLIHIEGLELDCIVGVRPLEREREQRVRLDLALGLDLTPAGRTGRIALTCDYDQIAEEVIALLRFRNYHLIEMATEEIAAMLLGAHPALESVGIKLDKPAALDGRARAASVEVTRHRSAFPRRRQPAPFGAVETILTTRDAGLYLVEVAAGASIPPESLRATRELEWVVAGELRHGGQPIGRHAPSVRASGDRPTGYDAPDSERAVLFRCTCPPALAGAAD